MMKGCDREIAGLPCCTVIHGDFGDYLPQFKPGAVDLVVTDPPYGIGYVSGARKQKYAPIVGDDRLPVEIIQQLIHLPRLASYFFCRWDNLWDHETLPKPSSVVTWIKPGTGMGDLNHEHGRATEIALFYPGTEHAFKKRPNDYLDSRRTGNVVHPTQKPHELMREMLGWYNFETVLDPYVGGGATALAAIQLKKHFIAFEIDEGHFRTAAQRVESLRGRTFDTSEYRLDFGE